MGRERYIVEARYPTAETQAQLFGGLYQLFANKRLTIYPHEELRREALNLVVRTVGGRMKVVDSAAIHQDHVVALGGAAGMLLEPVRKRQLRFIGWLDGPGLYHSAGTLAYLVG